MILRFTFSICQRDMSPQSNNKIYYIRNRELECSILGSPDPPNNCNATMSKSDSFKITCDPGFDGGAPQQFNLIILNTKLNTVIMNRTSIVPVFNVQGLTTNLTTVYQASIYSYNLKGRSDTVHLPSITIDAQENNSLVYWWQSLPAIYFFSDPSPETSDMTFSMKRFLIWMVQSHELLRKEKMTKTEKVQIQLNWI